MPETLACSACGIATDDATTCPGCRAREYAAHEAARTLPRLARFGNVGPVHLAAALHGLAALGVRQPYPITEADATALVRVMAAPGAAALRESPRNASLDGCSASPWAHVPAAVSNDLRVAYARLCAERVARNAEPVPIPAPDGSGCLLCGVWAVMVPATRAAVAGGPGRVVGVWEAVATSAAALGGPSSPGPVKGWECPPCREAVLWAGAQGQRAARRALAAFLRAEGRQAEADTLQGAELDVIGWGGLWAREQRHGRTPAPNAEPWEHVVIGPADDEPAPAQLLPGEGLL